MGLVLRLHPDELELIEADHLQKGVMSCLRVVVDKWLRKSYNTATHGLPSWELLVAAIADPIGGDKRALAEEIARKHNGKMQQHTDILIVCLYLPNKGCKRN